MVILAMVIYGMAQQKAKCAKQKDLIKVKNQGNKVQKIVSTVEDQVMKTNKKMDSLDLNQNQTNEMMTKFSSDISEVQNKVTKTNKKLDSLDLNQNQTNEMMTKFSSDISEVQNKVTKTNKKLDSLDLNQNQTNEMMTKFSSDISEVQEKVMETNKKMDVLDLKFSNSLAEVKTLLHQVIEGIEAILITGGYHVAGGYFDVASSVELFFPQSGKKCSLHPLPQARYFHTLDTLPGNIPILCGGGGHTASAQSCLYFTSPASPWTSVNTTLAEIRYQHSSWVHGEDLVLIGGSYSFTTAETLYKESNFTIDYDYWWGCSIQLEKTVILTGGVYTGDRVSVYNVDGKVEDLPRLLTERYGHGCGSYYQNGNMVYVVAGGYDLSSLHSSTETLREGSSAWSYGATLPRALRDLASVSAGNNIYLIGGEDDGINYRAEILKFENSKWTQIGVMKNARRGCAATMVKINGNTCG